MTPSAESLQRPTQIGFRMPLSEDTPDQVQQLWVDYNEFLGAFCENSNNSKIAASLFSMSIGSVVMGLLNKYRTSKNPLEITRLKIPKGTASKELTTRRALYRALRITLEAEEDSYRHGDGGGIAEEPLTRTLRVSHVTNFASCMMEAFNLTDKERAVAATIIAEDVISGKHVVIGKNIDD